MESLKLCMSTISTPELEIPEQLPRFKAQGLDAFFTRYDPHVREYRELADKLGLIYQSVHAPNHMTEKFWDSREAAVPAVAEWIQCVKDCSEAGVPIMVAHAYRGIGIQCEVTQERIDNFRYVVDAAVKYGVNIAFENTEGQEYLTVILDTFADCPNVGFCWDTGHEFCYNRGQDMTANRGHRMICTHLNDNLGCRTGDETISAKDDLHLLPFDGFVNWQSVVDRMKKWNYQNILTFELKKTAYYQDLSFDCYLQEAYNRIQRVISLY